MENEQQGLNAWATEIFVGNNYEYYKWQWKNQTPGRSFTSFNWPAFFFPFYWMVYRKMYFYAFIVLIISAFSTFFPPIGLILHVVVGVFANYYYLNRCHKVLGGAAGLPREEAEVYFKKHGNTSTAALVAAIIIISLLATITLGRTAINKLRSNETSQTFTKLLDKSIYSFEIPSELTKEFTTANGEVTTKVSSEFVKSSSIYHDLQLNSTKNEVVLTLDILHPEDFGKNVVEQDLINMVIAGYSETSAPTLITDQELPQLDSQLTQCLYTVEDEGDILYLHLCCKKVDNYYIMSILCLSPSQWDNYKEQSVEIISNAKPIY